MRRRSVWNKPRKTNGWSVMNDEPSTSNEKWIRKAFGFIGKHAAASIVASVAFSVAFMIFNDYIFPPPSLSGRWKFTVIYEDTRSQVSGHAGDLSGLLIQEGLHLTGSGRRSLRGEPYDWSGRVFRRGPGQRSVVRQHRRNYFSPDELIIHYKEAGARRQESTLHETQNIRSAVHVRLPCDDDREHTRHCLVAASPGTVARPRPRLVRRWTSAVLSNAPENHESGPRSPM